MSPSIAKRIMNVWSKKERGKEKYYAIMKLYPALEAHSSEHETVRGKPITKFEADEIRAMAHRFNRKEAHWPLYTFFEHKQSEKTYMGQVVKMWYNEKDQWMNAEVELNSAETAQRILKENLGCSLCLARTGDDKSLVEFSFVKQGNLVKSEVTTVYRNSACADSDEPDPHFPPHHNGAVHFIPLEAGPWIEKNTAVSSQMEHKEQQEPASGQQQEQQEQPPAEKPADDDKVAMEDDAAGVDEDEAAFASLPPEQQQKMRRVLFERAHEAESLKQQNEKLSQQMAFINAEKQKVEREQHVSAHMDLARKMMTSLRENDRDMKDEDFRVLAEEFADLASNKDTALFMGLLGKQQQKLDALSKELEETRSNSRKPAEEPTRPASSSRQKEILNALQKANVHPPSLQKNNMNTQSAKRQVTGGTSLFKSLLDSCAERAAHPTTGLQSPSMQGAGRARIEAHSAHGKEEKSDEESVIAQMVAREQRMASRMNKRKAQRQLTPTVLEANSSFDNDDDPHNDARYASENGTNVVPFLRQRGFLGGAEGDLRNESLKRARTARNHELVVESHSAETEDFVVQSIPRRKNGEGATNDELRALMFEDVAAHVDEYLRSGREHEINQSMLMQDPELFNFIIDRKLEQTDEIPTNGSMGLIDRKHFNKLSAEDRKNPDYWFFNHGSFEKAEINPRTDILVEY